MILDIIVIILFMVAFLVGIKRGVTYSFFSLFRYILIIFFMENIFKLLKNFYKINEKEGIKQLEIFIIIFLIIYIILTIFLTFNKKFLKSIKLKKYNNFLGGILGIIEFSFIIFIICVTVLVGSTNSKRITKNRDESYTIKFVTDYLYFYEKIFPDFVKADVEMYRKSKRKEEIKQKILNDFKEEMLNVKVSEEKNENKNNR